ncbi:hypothetical protein DSCO28_50560 [Desulfosarcina ovata subsp. sediminis]|uniref:Uncharacterized protein n=1 Tax=Desulfosarcina ovata subsp. sediminis TaxID=885957 RepID=A0A5K7ZFT7_9BACT|nr:hypothetical protein [Desulfosarcina ovata]BBO80184.1 hypothetical protein DSCO28_07500 [Desulfosarcina ovata subsp. sediminis]BBO84490.1 hypothetical protein DSCO28_50560 [Desulfosarcina ovata subsp. sediminis]
MATEKSKKWYQSKTVWTGAAGLLTAAGTYVAGEMTSAEAIQTGLTALTAIFLRTGMLK